MDRRLHSSSPEVGRQAAAANMTEAVETCVPIVRCSVPSRLWQSRNIVCSAGELRRCRAPVGRLNATPMADAARPDTARDLPWLSRDLSYTADAVGRSRVNHWRTFLFIVCVSGVVTPASAGLLAAEGRPTCGCGGNSSGGSDHSRWRPPVYVWLAGAAAMLGLTRGKEADSSGPLSLAPRRTEIPAKISHPAVPRAEPIPPLPGQEQAPNSAAVPAHATRPAPVPSPAGDVSIPPRGLLAPLTASPLPLLAFLGVGLFLCGAVFLWKERSKTSNAAGAMR